MGVSGALVWCVTNDTWIPFRLDAVKLSGEITKAHWESVAELVRLLATNQLVLRTGSTSADVPDEATAATAAAAVVQNAAPVLTLLKDTTPADGQPMQSQSLEKSSVEDASQSCRVVSSTFNKVYPVVVALEERKNAIDGKTGVGGEAQPDSATADSKAVTFSLTSNSLDILSTLSRHKERRTEAIRRRRNSTDSVHSCSSLDESARAKEVTGLESLSSASVKSGDSDRSIADQTIVEDVVLEEALDPSKNVGEAKDSPRGQYIPQETPSWLKLLQRYHDSKRLEKQIQRQREAWARNKRFLRRESVPKCMFGLSRYVQ